MSNTVVDIRDHGAASGDVDDATAEANREAVQAAVAVAMDTGLPLFIPAGEWKIGFPGVQVPDPASEPPRHRDLTVIGASRDLSSIRCPDNVANPYYCFRMTAPGRFRASELTFRAPVQASSVVADTRMAIGARRNMENDTAPTEIHLSDVVIEGRFTTGVTASNEQTDACASPGVMVRIERCDISADVVGVSVYDGLNNAVESYLHVRDTYFRRAKGWQGEGQTLHIYIHPHVALDISRCRFGETHHEAYAIAHFSAAGITSAAPLRYARITACEFESTGSVAIACSPNGLTHIHGCTFRQPSTAIQVAADAMISYCRFVGPATAISGIGTQDRPPVISVIGCRFEGSGSTVSCDFDGATWLISNCIWDGFDSGSGVIINHGHIEWEDPVGVKNKRPRNNYLMVDHCSFASVQASAAINSATGRATIRNSRFKGYFGSNAAILGSNLVVESCDFVDVAEAGRAFIQDGSQPAFGWDNQFGMADQVAPPTTSSQGSHTVPMDVQALPTVSSFHLRRATAPFSLASAPEIYPFYDWDTYHVDGTETISYIVLHGNPAAQRVCAGRLYLIAGSAWQVDSNGNVVPKTAGPRTPGQLYIFAYHQSSQKWVEV